MSNKNDIESTLSEYWNWSGSSNGTCTYEHGVDDEIALYNYRGNLGDTDEEEHYGVENAMEAN